MGADVNALSKREEQILQLATRGRTDIQIGLELGICTSTVSSYWQRIRSKLGQRSRTELVANTLKAKALRDLEFLTEKTRHLEMIVEQRGRTEEVVGTAEPYRLVLNTLIDGILILDREGNIVFANKKFNELFGYFPEEITKKNWSALVPHRNQLQEKNWLKSYLSNPSNLQIGVDEIFYGSRKDGTELRLIVNFGVPVASRETIITVIIKSFALEMDRSRRLLDAKLNNG